MELTAQRITRQGRTRPGWYIYDVLSGQLPLMRRDGTQAIVSEAYIAELAYGYRQLAKSKPTYASFRTVFKYARYLGLVELVREDEPNPPATNLYQLPGRRATRHVHRLTDKGRADTVSWNDLRTAWSKSLAQPSGTEG